MSQHKYGKGNTSDQGLRQQKREGRRGEWKLHWVERSEYLTVEKQEEDNHGGKGSPRPGCVPAENPRACRGAPSGRAAPGGWHGFRAAAPSVGSCRDHGS